MPNEERIKKLEELNADLAKEILLNETAIYETEKEIDLLGTELLEHPRIQQYVNNLKLLIERIQKKNEIHKREIFENELEISKLKEEDDENE